VAAGDQILNNQNSISQKLVKIWIYYINTIEKIIVRENEYRKGDDILFGQLINN